MLIVGDKVKLNIYAIELNGMSDNKEQCEKFKYIESHPEEVYEVKCFSDIDALAPYILDHPILGGTSFFEDELILVERRV